MQVRIFRPAKTAMQSGRARTRCWVLEFEPTAPRVTDPLMGWVGSADVQGQVQLSFATREEAVAYATRHGYEFRIDEPHERTVRPKSYADNFKPDQFI